MENFINIALYTITLLCLLVSMLCIFARYRRLGSFWGVIARIISKPRIAEYLIARAMKTPYTHLPSNEDPSYMARYWVFNPYDRVTNKPRWRFIPWSIRIHHIKRRDSDQALHDHPWNARTVILKGSYAERRLAPDLHNWADMTLRRHGLDGKPHEVSEYFVRWPGDTAKLGFEEYHQITEVSDGGVWTLFISGPWQGVWGFLVDGVKVPHKKYLDYPEKGDLSDAAKPTEYSTPGGVAFIGLRPDEEPTILEPGEMVAPESTTFAKVNPLASKSLGPMGKFFTDDAENEGPVSLFTPRPRTFWKAPNKEELEIMQANHDKFMGRASSKDYIDNVLIELDKQERDPRAGTSMLPNINGRYGKFGSFVSGPTGGLVYNPLLFHGEVPAILSPGEVSIPDLDLRMGTESFDELLQRVNDCSCETTCQFCDPTNALDYRRD